MSWITASYRTLRSKFWARRLSKWRSRMAANLTLLWRRDAASGRHGNATSYRPSTIDTDFSNSCNTGFTFTGSFSTIPMDSRFQKDLMTSSVTFKHNNWWDTLWSIPMWHEGTGPETIQPNTVAWAIMPAVSQLTTCGKTNLQYASKPIKRFTLTTEPQS